MFVSHEIALELKKLGFDEPCFGYYYNRELSFGARTSYGEVVEAPTFSQALDFFEKEYQIFVEREVVTTPNEILDITYRLKSWKFPPVTIEFEKPYDCFVSKKAKTICLNKIIGILKNN